MLLLLTRKSTTEKTSIEQQKASPAADSNYTTPQSTPPSNTRQKERMPFQILAPSKAGQPRDTAKPYEDIKTWLASSESGALVINEETDVDVFGEPSTHNIRGRSSAIMVKKKPVSAAPAVQTKSRGFVDEDGARYNRLPDKRDDIPSVPSPPTSAEQNHQQHPDIYARLRIKNAKPTAISPMKPLAVPATNPSRPQSMAATPKCAGCSAAFLDKEALRLTCK